MSTHLEVPRHARPDYGANQSGSAHQSRMALRLSRVNDEANGFK